MPYNAAKYTTALQRVQIALNPRPEQSKGGMKGVGQIV
jgi:hypothetical protein